MELFYGLTDVVVTPAGDAATVKMGDDTFTLHTADSRGEFTVLEPQQTGWLIYGGDLGNIALVRWDGDEKRFNAITETINAKLKQASNTRAQIFPVVMISKNRDRDDVILRMADVPGDHRVRVWRGDKTGIIHVGKLTKHKKKS